MDCQQPAAQIRSQAHRTAQRTRHTQPWRAVRPRGGAAGRARRPERCGMIGRAVGSSRGAADPRERRDQASVAPARSTLSGERPGAVALRGCGARPSAHRTPSRPRSQSSHCSRHAARVRALPTRRSRTMATTRSKLACCTCAATAHSRKKESTAPSLHLARKRLTATRSPWSTPAYTLP